MNTKTLIAESLGTFNPPSSAFGIDAGQSAEAVGLEAATIFERILSIALGGFTIVAAVYFLFALTTAAYSWMSAADDQSKVQKARDTMTNGLIGLVLLVASYAIIGIIGTIFGIDILNPGTLLLELAP